MPNPFRVQPGDLITAELINSILTRLDALEAKAKETKEKEKDTKEKEKDTKENKDTKDKDKDTKENKDTKDKDKEKDGKEDAKEKDLIDTVEPKNTDTKPKELTEIPKDTDTKNADTKPKELTEIPKDTDTKITEFAAPPINPTMAPGSGLANLEPRVTHQSAAGRAFIRPEERPPVGQRALDGSGETG